MMKVFLIIYNSVGLIGGVVGPVPKWDACAAYVENATARMLARPDLEQLTFRCEWRESRPQLEVHE